MLWSKINALFDACSRLPHVGVAFLGFALLRGLNGWTIATLRALPDLGLPGGFNWHAAFIVGEVLGFAGMALAARRWSPCYRFGSYGVGALLAITVGTALVGAASFGIAGGAPVVIATVLGGVGHSVALLLWFELYGCLATQYALLAYAGSFFISFFIWLVTQSLDPGLTLGCMLVAPFASLAMLVSSLRHVSEGHLPRSLATVRARVPWKLLVWVGAFGFAYGVGHSITDTGFSTLFARIGMACPDAIVLVGTLFLSARFDFKALYRMTLLFMVAGISLAVFLQGNLDLSQVLMSTANESYLVLAYAIGWAIAYRLGCSAVYICGLTCAVNMTAIQFGIALGGYAQMAGGAFIPLPALGALAVIVTVAVSVSVFKEQDYTDAFSQGELVGAPAVTEGGQVSGSPAENTVAERFELSRREAIILGYLEKGLSAPEIAEELFCAPSTVRAHTTHIYQKMGIHSRKELRELLEREG